jgi:hypothetical protein
MTPVTRSFCSKDFSNNTQASSRLAFSRDKTASPFLFLDFVAGRELGYFAGLHELLERDAAFRLEAHVDHSAVAFDSNHGALEDRAFQSSVSAERFFQQRGEILFRRAGLCFRGFGCGVGHVS